MENRLNDRFTHFGFQVIQLRRVGPAGEVRVLAVREPADAVPGLLGERVPVRLAALDKEFRALDEPRMIEVPEPRAAQEHERESARRRDREHRPVLRAPPLRHDRLRAEQLAPNAQAESPKDQLQGTIDSVIKVLRTIESRADIERNRESISKILLTRFDYTAMAQRSLGNRWVDLNGKEKERAAEMFGKKFVETLNQFSRYAGKSCHISSHAIEYKPTIVWSWEDVQTLRPNWGKRKCMDALGNIGGHLEGRSTELGWEVLETLLDCEC